MKLINSLLLAAFISFSLTGCSTVKTALLNEFEIERPVEKINQATGEKVVIMEKAVEYKPNPLITETIKAAGDLSPLPFSGLVSSALVTLLGAYAGFANGKKKSEIVTKALIQGIENAGETEDGKKIKAQVVSYVKEKARDLGVKEDLDKLVEKHT